MTLWDGVYLFFSRLWSLLEPMSLWSSWIVGLEMILTVASVR